MSGPIPTIATRRDIWLMRTTPRSDAYYRNRTNKAVAAREKLSLREKSCRCARKCVAARESLSLREKVCRCARKCVAARESVSLRGRVYHRRVAVLYIELKREHCPDMS